MTVLLDNVSTDTTSNEFIGEGGSAIVNIRADDFDGASLEIQTASIGDSLNRFIVLPDGTFTADASVKIDYLPLGTKLRVDLSSTGGSTSNVFCDILQ